MEEQAVEVWQGLSLLSEAILQAQALQANSSQPPENLQLHIDKAISGLRSLTSLLRVLGAQVSVSVCEPCYLPFYRTRQERLKNMEV